VSTVIFVVPFFMEATLRFVAGAAQLEGTRLAIISQDPLERLPPDVRGRIAGHWRISDGLDAGQIAGAIEALSQQLGKPDRIIGSLEQLQVPLAKVRAHFGLPGLSVEAAENFRDKATMKRVLEAAGLPCARHQLIVQPTDAFSFTREVGYPVVVKPPAGAGAVNTYRLEDSAQLEAYLGRPPPDARRPALFEEFLQGEEHSFDSVAIDGRIVWYSISRYLPAPLTVLENAWIQWCVLLPREIEGPEYDEIRAAAGPALRALGLTTGMTHMEWFRRADGGIAISEVAARPPGAQFTTLISYSSNCDFYRAWPSLMVTDEFTVPRRDFSAGAAYLRGMGTGRVRAVHGLAQAQRELGSLVVEARLPQAGHAQPTGYEGAGYIIVRHPETRVVEQALRRAVELIRVELG
jgi:D-alanine-D-alanine ligase-like ATP-grasp enzyme